MAGSSPGRDVVLRMLVWAAVMGTYLTLWSAGPGWTRHWWAWLFVLAPVVLTAVVRPAPAAPVPGVPAPAAPEARAEGFVPPRVRFPTSHRRRRRPVR